ncbi:hypothetical protein C8R43DRAFT_411171 [Mycena crocata]|nr:hypothetical protein C8R43DRAFT_411171 [Mycena crocata]
MALIRCRAFLGCVALRTGVWFLALIAMLISGPGAAGSWLEVYWMTHHPLGLRDKVITIIQAGVFSSLFLLSPLGFVAALKRARGACYIYSKFILIHTPLLLLSLGLSLFTTLSPDKSDSKGVEKCLNGSPSPIIAQFCNHDLSLVRILPIAFLGASILVQFYVWIISISYAENLDVDAAASEFEKYNGSDSDLESHTRSMWPEPPFARR